MNIAKNDTVKINCQPELGEGIVRDIFQIEGGPTNIVVSFGDQGKIDYFFPCELTKVGTITTIPNNLSYQTKLGCPKCGNTSCKCQETKLAFNLPAEKFKVDAMFVGKLQELLEIPVKDLTTAQVNLIVEMYKLVK